MERANQYFVNFSLLIMPVLMVLFKSAASTYVGVCLLWSLAVVWFVPSKLAFHKWEKLVVYSVLAYVLLALLNLFWGGYNYVGAKQLGYIIRLLAVIPILVALHRARPNLHLFMLGGTMAAVTSFAYAVYDVEYSQLWRATGSTDSILFGDFSVLFAAVAGFYALYWLGKGRGFKAICCTAAFCGAMVAAWASSTRGALIVVPIMFVGYFSYAAIEYNINVKTKLVLAILACLLVGVVSFNSSIKGRFNAAFSELENYQPGQSSSIGRRLDAWYESYMAFSKNPFFGVGHGHQEAFVEAQKKAGVKGMGSAQIYDSHNDYFFVLSRRGGIGLLSHIMLLLMPMFMFLSALRKSSTSHQLLAAACGVAVISSYAIFGLSITLFVRSQALCIFAYLLAILTYFTVNENSTNNMSKS